MKFKSRNLRELAEMIIGDADHFHYRSSSYITRFFEECDLDFVHDGSTRWSWTSSILEELLQEPQSGPNLLPDSFVKVFQVLMEKSDATDDDPDRSKALSALNKTLHREGYEAFYGENGFLHFKHIRTQSVSAAPNPHRPFTTAELKKRDDLSNYLDKCSEDELIERVLLPSFDNSAITAYPQPATKTKHLSTAKISGCATFYQPSMFFTSGYKPRRESWTHPACQEHQTRTSRRSTIKP